MIGTVAIAAVVLMVGAWVVLPWTLIRVVRRRQAIRCAQSGLCALTFDDGPDPVATPLVLDALREAGARATFFCLGRQMERYPDLVERIRTEGHELALHGYAHHHPWKTGPVRTIRDHVRTAGVARRFGIAPPILYRPPYGKLNLAGAFALIASRWRPVFWTDDPRDYALDDAPSLADRVASACRAGRVVLLHDGRAETRNRSAANDTAGALTAALSVATGESGVPMETVGEVLWTRRPVR